ncbi:MAG: sensor domain-containing protein, partial [[Mycobacterium] stephanolepidis]
MRSAVGALVVALGALHPAVATAEPSPNVPPSAIDRLMITQPEAERVMGVALPNVQRQSATFALDTDRPDCGSVVLASVSSYDRSPYV